MMAGVTQWHISGAAVQGLRHEEENIPCQDKIFAAAQNGITAVALADGAGSAKLSHFGAEEAVRVACELLCEKFREFVDAEDSGEVRRAVLECLMSELEGIAQEKGCSIRDLASTLLAVAVDEENVLMLHIGDGLIACCRDGRFFAASLPDNGEFADETVFVTSGDAFRRMRLYKGKSEGISGFALMSDGAEFSFYSRRQERFSELLNEIKHRCIMYPIDESSADLEYLFRTVIRENTRDDCSMIIMCRPDEYFRGYRDLCGEDRADFLGVSRPEKIADCEKVFSMFEGKGFVSRADIIKQGCAFGMKRRKIQRLIRELEREGYIERISENSKTYRLSFCW
ncbi:MAG: protein phosphatase 2C domain-containing protein [Synergistaceae bacterium]|nr:protein phosphatase 2C domain-containing protein [Synergistaceae bacterium]